MNNRNNALDDLIKQERLAYQKRVRRLREQARKEEERLALRTAEIIRTEHPDTYSKYEEEARRLLEEERLARSSRAKRACGLLPSKQRSITSQTAMSSSVGR